MIKKIIGCVVFVVLFVVINMGLDYIFNPFIQKIYILTMTSTLCARFFIQSREHTFGCARAIMVIFWLLFKIGVDIHSQSDII